MSRYLTEHEDHKIKVQLH